MAKTIKSISELKKIIKGQLALALKLTQQEIFEVIQRHITDYYKEPVFRGGSTTPVEYERTWSFLNSLIKTGVEVSGGNVSCKIKIDMGALDYVQSPETVISMINAGYHADPVLNDGNYKTPYAIPAQSHFWNDAIAELGGEAGIYKLLELNCKKVGLSLK